MLKSYHVRNWEGIINYIGLSMLAYNMAAWMRERCDLPIPTLVTQFRRYAVVQQAHQLASAHIQKLSAEIEALSAKQHITYELLKHILQRYHTIIPDTPELFIETQKYA